MSHNSKKIINLNIDNLNDHLDNELSRILNKNKSSIKKTILVLSGGGIKGIAHIGALHALSDLDLLKHIKTIAGTSVGALIGFFYIIGYSPSELSSIIKKINLGNMKSLNPIKLLEDFSIDDGKKLISVIHLMMTAKKLDINITFKQLYLQTKISFIVTSVCLNNKQAYYFSHKNSPNMSVSQAVLMSTAVPIYFPPILYENKLFIDGGCIDNYPINMFSDKLDQVIGIYLCEHIDFKEKIENFEDFLLNLLQCLLEGVTCNSIKGFEKYTIIIKLPRVSLLNMDLSNAKRQEIFDVGYKTVKEKLNVT